MTGTTSTTTTDVLVAQVNRHWRVLLQPDPSGAFKGRLWILQRLVDGAWCAHFTTRSADMLSWAIRGKDVVRLAPGIPAILAALPARVDLRSPSEPRPERLSKRALAALRARPEAPEPSAAPEPPASRPPLSRAEHVARGRLLRKVAADLGLTLTAALGQTLGQARSR
jgi:hypothetical protein